MTQETNLDPNTHGDVLAVVNNNANDAEGRLSGIENLPSLGNAIITFYVDWATGELIDKDAFSTPSGLAANGTVSILQNSAIVTPAGDTLDNYKILRVNAQFLRATVPYWQDGESATLRNGGSSPDLSYGLQGYAYEDFIGMRVGDAGSSIGYKWNTILSKSIVGQPSDTRIEITALRKLQPV